MTTRRNVLLGGGALAVACAGTAYAALRSMGSLDEYADAVAAARAALDKTPEIADFIRFATLAASGHNTQPWMFLVGANRVGILPDLSRRTPVVDPDDHHLLVSLGCAAENLALASFWRDRAPDPRTMSGYRWRRNQGDAACLKLMLNAGHDYRPQSMTSRFVLGCNRMTLNAVSG